MRAASSALIALLNGQHQFYVADLLTITQQSGAVTRLTSADTAIVANGFTFASGLPFTRDKTRLVVGLEVDTMALTLMPNPVLHLLGGVPWPAACAQGALDEARITLERAFMPTFGDTAAGTIILFSGRAGTVTPSRTQVAIAVHADLELLQLSMPRNAYQPGCVHTLFDAGCTLAKAAFAVTGTAGAGCTARLLTSALAQAADYFALGTLTFTSGALSGQSYTVRSFSGGSFIPTRPFAAAPVAGDTFTAYPGCDKQQATCSGKFSNLAHFRGFPYIPTPENAR